MNFTNIFVIVINSSIGIAVIKWLIDSYSAIRVIRTDLKYMKESLDKLESNFLKHIQE